MEPATGRHNKPPAKLRRGRHPLTRQAVAASQRERMLLAVAQAVTRKGYAAATVADVVELAAVSRRTFYEQFPDLDSCFFAAFEAGAQRLIDRVRSALSSLPKSDWRARASTSIDAYLQGLEAEPELAWAFTIEALGAGPQVRARRSAVLQQWVQQWRSLQSIALGSNETSRSNTDQELLVLVGGIEELIRDHLCAGRRRLRQLAHPLAAIAIRAIGRDAC